MFIEWRRQINIFYIIIFILLYQTVQSEGNERLLKKCDNWLSDILSLSSLHHKTCTLRKHSSCKKVGGNSWAPLWNLKWQMGHPMVSYNKFAIWARACYFQFRCTNLLTLESLIFIANAGLQRTPKLLYWHFYRVRTVMSLAQGPLCRKWGLK